MRLMNHDTSQRWRLRPFLACALLALGLLAGCRQQSAVAPEDLAALPTTAAVAPDALFTATAAAPTPPPPPATWTPVPTLPPPPTSTPRPTVTKAPTNTPAPLPTNTPPPTDTPVPTATAVPPATNTPAAAVGAPPPTAIPANPVLGANRLPNPSFENGWYNQNGIPELQLPNEWQFSWDEGPTGFGSQPWDVFVRPETRVLPALQLPPAEHPLYIYDGQYTIKMFKGSGAVSFRLWTNVTLEPGTYIFEVNLFPDLVMGYTADRKKIWANDPDAGELQLWSSVGSTGWMRLTYGQRNTRTYTLTLNETRSLDIGIWARGRYAIPNNGFFFDDWQLQRIDG